MYYIISVTRESQSYSEVVSHDRSLKILRNSFLLTEGRKMEIPTRVKLSTDDP